MGGEKSRGKSRRKGRGRCRGTGLTLGKDRGEGVELGEEDLEQLGVRVRLSRCLLLLRGAFDFFGLEDSDAVGAPRLVGLRQ